MPAKAKTSAAPTKKAASAVPYTAEQKAAKKAAREEKKKSVAAQFKENREKRVNEAKEKKSLQVKARKDASAAKKASEAPKEGEKVKKTTPSQRRLEHHRASVAAAKALKVSSAVKKGTRVHSRKVRTSVTFKRPRVLELPKAPKYQRHAVRRNSELGNYEVLAHPVTTESAMKKIEENNTLVFVVNKNANKRQIAVAVKKLYEVKASQVNTMFQTNGLKKAYVKLAPEVDALDVANKIGII
jgi:large subunit ribosomal protein L23Ae